MNIELLSLTICVLVKMNSISMFSTEKGWQDRMFWDHGEEGLTPNRSTEELQI